MINSIIKQIGVMIDNASLRLLVAVGGNNVLGPNYITRDVYDDTRRTDTQTPTLCISTRIRESS